MKIEQISNAHTAKIDPIKELSVAYYLAKALHYQMRYLRESGSIEQDADMVMFIHRPEVYGIEAFEDGTSTVGRAELIIAKHRNGSIGTIDVGFDGKRTLFHDLETYNTPF